MIDAYEIGQRLTAEDFADDAYFPSARWDYAEVTDIRDDTVTLKYVDLNMGTEDLETWTRSEMEEMLGWNVSGDDNVFDVIDERSEPRGDAEELAGDILSNSTVEEKAGSYALLSDSVPALVKTSDGAIRELRIFDTRNAAKRSLRRLAR